MVRPRAAAVRVPQNMEMAELIVNLQARLDAQEQENQVIRQQIAQLTQQQPQVETPPPPVVPAAPAVPVNPDARPVVCQEPLFERFRRMKPLEFEGSTNPLEAEEWGKSKKNDTNVSARDSCGS
ncbi:hypothetical protein TIFTF001_031397 [Ficus carica]|uniref:Uncharacterized protein n=1 Tax=Ficus carica TaxID=3494 RepID=A0AA88DUY8_FICCA|nr:hypothetical protein TIFTF001_031397 [Ficus carica]